MEDVIDFEDLVAQALDSLPPDIAAQVENVDVVVEDEPRRTFEPSSRPELRCSGSITASH
jgi:predicted Zn-dependent protease with MMP-like domain